MVVDSPTDMLYYVRQFRLNLGGAAVWTPYWINRDGAPYWSGAPLRGKGTWREIGLATRSHARNEAALPETAEAWRMLMRRYGLGIDCSGLVYHVLNGWLLATRGFGVADGLLIRRDEITERNNRLPVLAQRWGDTDIRHNLSLGQACRTWGIDPVPLVDVNRLTDEVVARRIPQVGLMRPGDLIRTSTADSQHVGVIVAVHPRRITYVDSAAPAPGQGGFGGVELRSIAVVDPQAGLEAQDWDQNRMFHPDRAGSRDAVWRLALLEDGVAS